MISQLFILPAALKSYAYHTLSQQFRWELIKI